MTVVSTGRLFSVRVRLGWPQSYSIVTFAATVSRDSDETPYAWTRHTILTARFIKAEYPFRHNSLIDVIKYTQNYDSSSSGEWHGGS